MNAGLYGGATILYGNMVSEKNEHKTRRRWIPNAHRKKLWSELLGQFIQVRLTLRVLRTIDKVGGIDEYLLGSDSPARIKALGVAGWDLRWKVMQTEGYQERIKRERRRLGLPAEGWKEAEKERIRKERRVAFAAVGQYLDLVRAERKLALAKAREAEDGSIDPPRDEASASPSEEEAAIETDEQPPYDSYEYQGPAASATDEAAETATSLEVTAALASVDDHARKLGWTRNSLIKQATDLQRLQVKQEAARLAREEELETKRNAYTAEIDEAFSSHDRGRVLRLYKRYLQLHHAEIQARHERQGLEPLSQDELNTSHFGPLWGVSPEQWDRLAKRAGEVDLAWRERDLRQEQKKKEKAAEEEARARSEVGGEKMEAVVPQAPAPAPAPAPASRPKTAPKKATTATTKTKVPPPKQKLSLWGRIKEVVFRPGMK